MAVVVNYEVKYSGISDYKAIKPELDKAKDCEGLREFRVAFGRLADIRESYWRRPWSSHRATIDTEQKLLYDVVLSRLTEECRQEGPRTLCGLKAVVTEDNLCIPDKNGVPPLGKMFCAFIAALPCSPPVN